MMSTQESNILLHILRNPSGWSDETVRDARTKAANELERLWRLEKSVQFATSELEAIVNREKK